MFSETFSNIVSITYDYEHSLSGTSKSSAKTSGKIGGTIMIYILVVNFAGSVFGVFCGLILKEGRHEIYEGKGLSFSWLLILEGGLK